MIPTEAAAILRRAHMHDSSRIRAEAARISVALDDLAALLDGHDPAARQRARLVAALRAERFTPVTNRPTTNL